MSSPMPKIPWGCKKRGRKVESSEDSDETYFDGSPLRITTVKETAASQEAISNDSKPGFQPLLHTSKIDDDVEYMSSIDTQMSSIKLSSSRSPRHRGSSRKLTWKEPVASGSQSQHEKHFPKPSPKGKKLAAQLNDIRGKLNKMSVKLTRSLLAGSLPLTCDEAELMLQKTKRYLEGLDKLVHKSPKIINDSCLVTDKIAKDARLIADKIIKRVNKKIQELEEEHRESQSQQWSVDRANATWFNDGSSLDLSTQSQTKTTNDLTSQQSEFQVILDNGQELPKTQSAFDSSALSPSQEPSPSQAQMTTKGFTLSGKHLETMSQSANEGNMKLTNFQTQSQLQRSENSSPSQSQMQFNGGTTRKLDQIQLNIPEIQSKTREIIASDGLSQLQKDFLTQSQLQDLRDLTTSPSILTPEGKDQLEIQVDSQSQARSNSDSFESSSDMFASYDCQQVSQNKDDALEEDSGTRGEFGAVEGNFEENTRKSTDDDTVLPNGTQRTVGFGREFDKMSNLSDNTEEKAGNSDNCDDIMVLSCVSGEMIRINEEYDEVMDEMKEKQDRYRSSKASADNTGSTVRDIDSLPFTSSSVVFSQDFIEDSQPMDIESFKKLGRKENSAKVEKGGSNSLFDLSSNGISLPLRKEREGFVTKLWKKHLTLEDRMLKNTKQSPSKSLKSILKTNTVGCPMSKNVQFNKNVDVLGLSGAAQTKQNTAKKEKSQENAGFEQDSRVAGKDLPASFFSQSSDSLNGILKVNPTSEQFLNVSGQHLICEKVLSEAVTKSCAKQNVYEGKAKESVMTQKRPEKNIIVSSSSGKLDKEQQSALEFRDLELTLGTNLTENVMKDMSLKQMMPEDSQSTDFGAKSSVTKVSVGSELMSLTQEMLEDSQDFTETQLPSEFVQPSMTNLKNNEQSLMQMMLEDSQESCNSLSTTFVQPSVTNLSNISSGKQLAKETIVDQKENNAKSPTDFGEKRPISNFAENVICNDQSLTQMMLEDSQEMSLRSQQNEIAPSKLTGAIPKVRPANAAMKSPKWEGQTQSFGKCSFQPFVAPKSAVSQNGTFGMENDYSQTFGAVAKSQKQVFQENMSESNQVAAEINTFTRQSREGSQESQLLTSQTEHEFLQPEIPAKRGKKRPLPIAFSVTQKIVPVTSTIVVSQIPISADPDTTVTQTAKPIQTASNNAERYETFDRLILNMFDYENVMMRREKERQNSVGSETQSSAKQAENSATAFKIPNPAAKKSTGFLSELFYPKNLDPVQAAERKTILSLTHMCVKTPQDYAPKTKVISDFFQKPFTWENIPEDILKDLEDSSDEDA